jgi:haloalkane dehalogenase
MLQRPTWLSPQLFPFTSRALDVAGHRLHYVDEGKGPVLLMVHGNPTWSFLYRHLIAGLRDAFRCVAVDLPGFGLSEAAPGFDPLPRNHLTVLEQVVDQLGIRSFTPIVQDWGGPIGLGLAARRPDDVRGLVICNTLAFPVDDDPHFIRFSRFMGGPLGGLMIRRFNAFVNVMIPMGLRRRRLSREEMAHYRRPMDTLQRREATFVFPREILGSTAFLREVEAGLPRLKDKPVLLCWGTRDIAFRQKERARFESLFPRTTSVTLEGAGHFVQEDAPEEIIAALRAWWPREVER